MKITELDWILKGYELFALSSSASLKVEVLSKKVGVSKSSFYHHFADMEVFVEQLMALHLKNCEVIAAKEKLVETVDPALIGILLEHKLDLLFNRQLRVHKQHPVFETTLQKSNAIVGMEFVNIWVKDLKLQMGPVQLAAFFELALENFYLQINEQNLLQDWLSSYFKQLKRIADSISGSSVR